MKKSIQISLATLALSSLAFAELSKSEVEDIAEQYAEACMNQDFDLWKSIYYNPELCSRQIFEQHEGAFGRARNRFPLKKVSVGKIDELNAVIEFTGKNSVRWKGWLQLLPDGKVKYDPIFYPHPIGNISEAAKIVNNNIVLSRLRNTTMEDTSESIEFLLKSGIPTYNLKVNDSADNHLEAARKILDWVDENLTKWDNTEPYVYYPKKTL